MKINILYEVVLYVLAAAFCFSAMAADTGALQVTSRPGIRIYLDGEFRGITKAEEDGLYIEGLQPGNYEIRAEKTDFMWQKFPVQIKAGKTIEIKIGEFVQNIKIKQEGESDEGKIKAQVGKVIITSVPLRCEILFLGKDMDKTKDKVTIEGIPVGTHSIVFRRGVSTLKAEFDVQSGVTLEVIGHFRQGKVLVEKVVAGSKPASRVDKIGRDGAPMALIPAGEFQMGSSDGDDEKPVHTVYLDAFYMDVYEVTNAQYKKFIDVTGHGAPEYRGDSNLNAPNQPVVGVTWHDAVAYAKWAGKRLPTEAEWEKAARGGLVGKKYPWGDSISHDNANCRDTAGKDRWKYTARVGSFAPNGYGLYDMAGNVWEWCADWYDGEYYASSPRRNPTGPSSGKYRVLRGGSWDSGAYYLRAAYRLNLNPPLSSLNLGLRCVITAQG